MTYDLVWYFLYLPEKKKDSIVSQAFSTESRPTSLLEASCPDHVFLENTVHDATCPAHPGSSLCLSVRVSMTQVGNPAD